MFAKKYISLLVFALLGVLAGCSPASPVDVVTPSSPQVEASPPPPSPTADAQASPASPGFDCHQGVQGISVEECQGLVALYESTNGDNWKENSGWLADDTPCNWYGVTCAQGHVIELEFYYNKLAGSLPPDIGNLTYLKSLYLVSNQLSGPVPPEIEKLTELQVARLGDNQFSSIPAELFNLKKLITLDLWGNRLTGEIPDEINKLSNLQELNLSFNQFTGTIPPELGDLIFLHNLSLSHNQLSGPIPSRLGELANLNWLNLSLNQLTGSIPAELANLDQLDSLDLSYNQLSGTVPDSIAQMPVYGRRLWGNLFDGTILASEGTTTTVDDRGVQFTFHSDLASSVWPETVPAEKGTADAPGWLVYPEHPRFTFAYPRGSNDLYVSPFAAAWGPARIMIYPTEEYAEMSEFAKTEIEELRSLLETRSSVIENEMPALPQINAAQVFHAQVEYLDFQNGQGVRFISQYSQEISPIYNQSLFYTFQGLTEDGAYYVAAFFPLSAEGLPDEPFVEDYDAFSASYQDYLKETISQLDSFSADQFQPNLKTVDDLIQSLTVGAP